MSDNFETADMIDDLIMDERTAIACGLQFLRFWLLLRDLREGGESARWAWRARMARAGK